MCSYDGNTLRRRLIAVYCLLATILLGMPAYAERDGKTIIKDAIDHYRGVSSYSVVEMIIHRPDWQRNMKMRAWTEGLENSLVRIIAPKKDMGNGTLLRDDNMWSYTPKINRVIKIPSSMANQSWMGSDFSNNDIAKADDLIDKYQHTLTDTQTHDGQALYIISSIPHDDAPVVWGKEVVKIRADNVVLEHAFYDQSNVLVKKLVTLETKTLSGKPVATIQRMYKVDTPQEWTEIRIEEIKYDVKIPANMFTLSNLRNPRL